MKGPKRHPPTMAEIVVDARRTPARVAPSGQPRRERTIDIDGRCWVVSAQEIDPDEAWRLAEFSEFVVWDSCGCGGYCGIDVWRGASARRLIATGLAVVNGGSLWAIEDEDGRKGVLVEQDVAWGELG